jgi:histidinol dehydrogenase
MSALRFTGLLSDLSDADHALLFERALGGAPGLSSDVSKILRAVREEGDEALFGFAKIYDGVTLASLEVSREDRLAALARIDPVVRRALERAAENLQRVSRSQIPSPLELEVEPGVVVGRRADPLARAGVYAPGGKAAYPSSVLMGLVPARAAGVGEVILCSPPGPSGAPSDLVLAAAEIGGADRVFAVGGAGAVAAMAYGTCSVPNVDVIVGPGNAYVAEAKRQVSGDVRIDAPAGPSEIVVVADETADPAAVARELVAQAEHDEDACGVALVLGAGLGAVVAREVAERAARAERRAIIGTALGSRGAILEVRTLEEAWSFIAAFAPEHVLLSIRDPETALASVRNAGTVFLGATTSVAFGDYLTGSNHVLPTAGAARRWSGLSVLDFVRWTSWQRVSPSAARRLCSDTQSLARAEGLFAHADAAAAIVPIDGAGSIGTSALPPRERASLATVERYSPTRPKCAVDLTDNTNLFGPPPAVMAALSDIPPQAITRYPNPYADELCETLARSVCVDTSCVVTGCGSDDLLDAILRAFADPGDTVAYCPPTFGIVPSFAAANALRAEPARLDAESILRTRPRVIYLCAPNNPTGGALPDGLLSDLLERTSALVILDEAYVDFAPVASRAPEAARSPRLVVVRTLSKAYGLAGARVGWAVAAPAVVRAIERARGPYKVGALAERLALAALRDESWVRARAKDVIALRARFVEELVKRRLAPLPSQANFVCVPVPDARKTAEAMRARGVSVRAFADLEGIGDALRISIGPWPMLERCLDALDRASEVSP